MRPTFAALASLCLFSACSLDPCQSAQIAGAALVPGLGALAFAFICPSPTAPEQVPQSGLVVGQPAPDLTSEPSEDMAHPVDLAAECNTRWAGTPPQCPLGKHCMPWHQTAHGSAQKSQGPAHSGGGAHADVPACR